jgi:hypothetical protein
LAVIDAEAEGFYKVQARAGCEAGAGDVAGVRGNLRLMQDDVESWQAL